MKIYNSIEELIGNTPLLKLNKLKEKYSLKADIYAKLEYFNPAGSVKDRVGLSILNAAEREGKINKDSVIIEPTSGNTGIGIAAVAAARGYKTIIVMPETMSEERKKLMKAYGAELILTPGELGMSGAIAKADELAKEIDGGIVAGQFVNPANPQAHFETTGPEIYADLDGKIDIFVAGVGTGGTITGTGKYLKSKLNNVKIIGVEPAKSAVLSGKEKGAHGIQGIGAGFVPEVLDISVLDEIIAVTDEDAFSHARECGRTEGFLVGISAGAALHAAIKIAERPENEGKNIVVLLPDTGDRYLSTQLFGEE